LGIVYSPSICAAAGIFTTNRVQAAPVVVSRKVAESGKARAIVVNSGCANACTGEKGLKDAWTMAQKTAEAVGCRPEEVFVASTGVIGVPLPLTKVQQGIQQASASMSGTGGNKVADAMLTTDTVTKEVAVEVDLGKDQKIIIAGAAKGSGMIHPNMATMLAFITTDAAISAACLQDVLVQANAYSFNMISVDGDTSTNDTALLLANGLAGPEIPEISEGTEAFQRFCAALAALAQKLAKDVARDGEGATKLLEVRVTNARSQEDARKIARSVAASNLLKAALFGADANFGRALCAMGYSGGLFRPERVTIAFQSGQGEVVPLRQGVPCPFPEDQAKAVLSAQEIFIKADLDDGPASATAWGCDLTYDYVKINGDYRS
jgi:glutamate N-acetyltransferase/amino-acid N-acetyltransferase